MRDKVVIVSPKSFCFLKLYGIKKICKKKKKKFDLNLLHTPETTHVSIWLFQKEDVR